MKYTITKYTLQKARQLGVLIAPSTNPSKKLDVFNKNGLKLCSCGASGYGDYPTYLQTRGKEYADERRRLYRLRHNNDTRISGFYAMNLLW